MQVSKHYRTDLRIAFSDDPEWFKAFIIKNLSKIDKHIIVNSPKENPDILFYGDGKQGQHKHYRCRKVFITGENVYPNYRECDFSFTYLDIKDERNLRMTNYGMSYNPDDLIKEPDFADKLLAEPRDFCAAVVSNSNPIRTKRRIVFFQRLNESMRVNFGGSLFNNIGGRLIHHDGFVAKHRFYLCFENHAWPGYTTEKIACAMRNKCIPIYWGNPDIESEFNPESFIHVRRFKTDIEAVKYIIATYQDEARLRTYLEQPYFIGNKPNAVFDEDRLLKFLKKNLDSKIKRRPFICLPRIPFKILKKMQPYFEHIPKQ